MKHRTVRVAVAAIAVVAAATAGPGAARTSGPAAIQAGLGPTVRIVTPRAEDPPGATLVIQALVRPGTQPVVSVEAFLDGESLGIRKSQPYRWVVQAGARFGPTVIRVEALDAAGLRAADELLYGTGRNITFTAEVPIVTLNLLITDQKGRFVTGVRRDEITVRDNGIPQKILEFGGNQIPLRVVLLVDRSASVARKMDAVKSSVTEFCRELRPNDEVKLIAFNHRVASLTPFTTNHQLVSTFAAGLQPYGGTALYDAVVYALRQLQPPDWTDTDKRLALVVFTDGRDEDSVQGFERMLALIRAAGVTVYCVGAGDALHDNELRHVLRTIAYETGGQAFFERDVKDLRRGFRKASLAARSLYFISYQPSDMTPGWHEIDVQVQRKRVRLYHRRGYFRY